MACFSVLKKRSDFLAVAASGQKWVARGLVLQARVRPVEASKDDPKDAQDSCEVHGVQDKNQKEQKVENLCGAQDGGRVGFTATKKIGGAVVRNRAKRRLRALAREILQQKARLGVDYVLIARLDTAQCPYQDLARDLMTGLKKLKLLREAS